MQRTPEPFETAGVGQGRGKQDEEAAVHQDELQHIGPHHRPEARKRNVQRGEAGADQNRRQDRPARDLGE